jgi:UDP-N-acetylglucosamine 2-epimerase
MLLYHPETVGRHDGVKDLEAILLAIDRSGFQALAIGPNADAGGRAILDRLRTHRRPNVRFAESLTRNEYATLLNGAAALVGNSSSGVIEAPMLGIPAINVGSRQRGRTRGDNIIDVPASEELIAVAIATATAPGFRAQLSGASPYGSGEAARQIIDDLVSEPVNRRLLIKTVGGG